MSSRASADPLSVARGLGVELAKTAAARDLAGGTARAERELIRKSGLLRLIVPRELGGDGADWPTAMRVARTVAAADASLGHILGYHYLEVATPHLYGTAEQRDAFYGRTAALNLFWGNALNPLDPRTTLTPRGSRFLLDGVKSFCSGATDSDLLLVSATRSDTRKLAVMVVPTTRDGVAVQDDWNAMGQRQTDSGTVTFNAVRVDPEEVLGPPGPGGSVFATLRTCIVQLVLTNVLLGAGQGALSEARAYLHGKKPALGAPDPCSDPDVLRRIGELSLQLQGAEALADRAADHLQQAWEQGDDLTADDRGTCALAVAAAKVASARAGVDVSSGVFEVMGARAAAAGSQRLDRFWRNARTLSLHDPLDVKLRELGNWALNDALPRPGFYS